jgi:hypothetical protein
VATSSSGYAGSDSSSCQLVLHSQVQKVTEYPPQVTGLTSAEQIQTCSRSFSKDTEGRVGQDSLLPFCNPIFRSFSPLESNIRTLALLPSHVHSTCCRAGLPCRGHPHWTLHVGPPSPKSSFL